MTERSVLRRLSLMIPVLLASASMGCVRLQRYPADWPPIEQEALQDGCPDLAGSYEARGELDLANLLLAPYGVHAPEPFVFADRAQIGLEEGRMVLTFWSRDSRLARASLERGIDYECESGRMNLRALWGSDVTDFGVSYGRGRIQLGRARDGSLVARRRAFGVALSIIPFVAASDWHRFEPKGTRIGGRGAGGS